MPKKKTIHMPKAASHLTQARREGRHTMDDDEQPNIIQSCKVSHKNLKTQLKGRHTWVTSSIS
jgi:hypothetical protein